MHSVIHSVEDTFSILLVEDDPADSLLFKELISELTTDICVNHVENGLEALHFLQQKDQYQQAQRPHLILIDLNMPVMNGLEFLKEVKEMQEYKSIPVLVASTSDYNDDICQAYAAHAAGYIVKPSGYKEYMKMLELIQAYWRTLIRLPQRALSHRM